MFKKTVSYTLLALALVLLALVPLRQPAQPVDAAGVINRQSVTMLNGASAYTTTTYTAAYIVGAYGEIVLQVHDDISGTGVITITPQFSSQGTCSTASNWVDAAMSAVYGTSSLSYGTAAVQKSITNDSSVMFRFDTGGNCMRVKLASTKTFTPTVYAWMVNSQ